MAVLEIITMELGRFLKLDLSKIDTTESFRNHNSNGGGRNHFDQQLFLELAEILNQNLTRETFKRG